MNTAKIEIIKIIEWGYKGDAKKMRDYMGLYLQKYPDGDYSKYLKAFINGDDNPDGLELLTIKVTCCLCDKAIMETGTAYNGRPCHIRCYRTMQSVISS